MGPIQQHFYFLLLRKAYFWLASFRAFMTSLYGIQLKPTSLDSLHQTHVYKVLMKYKPSRSAVYHPGNSVPNTYVYISLRYVTLFIYKIYWPLSPSYCKVPPPPPPPPKSTAVLIFILSSIEILPIIQFSAFFFRYHNKLILAEYKNQNIFRQEHKLCSNITVHDCMVFTH